MNQEQLSALDAIFQDDQPLLITGHGGTGKTYTAVEAIKKAVSQNKSVLVLCPTHQAKEQFFQNVPINIQQKITIKTSASFLMQYPIRMPTGELFFQLGGAYSAEYDFIFVDETSMISEHDMINLASLDSKVVFFADYEQLRPVMKKQGTFWQTLKTIELTQQHRNAGAILRLASSARHGIIFPDQDSDCGSIRVLDSEAELFKTFTKRIKKSTEPYNISYLAYRNSVVNQRSADVHKMLHGIRPFVKHQYVRLGQSCVAGNNGSIVRIDKSRKIEVEFDHRTFDLYRCEITNINNGFHDTVQFMDLKTQNEFESIRLDLIGESHIAFKMKDFDYLDRLQSRLRKLEKIGCKSSSPYVQTVHKAQGRTIPEVFVNTLDIKAGNDRKRLLYVSYSRAKNSLTTIRV